MTFLTAWMGAGKSAIAATAIYELIRDGIVKRALVLSSLRITQVVWPAESALWAPKLRAASATGTPARRRQALTGDAQLVALNNENLVWAYDEGLLEDFDMLLVDESTKFKASTTKRFKVLKKLLPQFKIRVAMTGTPVSESLLDLWSQVYLLDRGKRLGRSYYKYRRQYFYPTDPNEWNWQPQPGALETIMTKIAPLICSVRNEEYADQLPDLSTVSVDIPMPPTMRPVFEEMRENYFLSLSGVEVEAGSGGVLANKLRQITSGFLYDDNSEPVWIATDRFDAFEELIEELGGEPVLVAYQYLAELHELQRRVPAPHLGSGVSNRQAVENIAAWNARELPVLYLHPASAGHGLNLQHGGHNLIWFSLPWSLEQFQQTRARLHRSGQGRPVIEHVLRIQGTMDAKVSDALRAKRNIQDEVLSWI